MTTVTAVFTRENGPFQGRCGDRGRHEDRVRAVARSRSPVQNFSSARLQSSASAPVVVEYVRPDGSAEEERSKDSLSTTAPIWSPDDSLLGTINLVANTGDTTRKELERHTSTLLQASRRITAQM
ncbi:hypothetical protein [Brevibacterium casei]|uniref:hypothetical protein n=1 Tax=Brevibacterium casei TaxID=33889 RepID=UPI001595E9AE|nr:hypothetical protein [Brevibacterium casei]